jgi:hypothetical protein
MEVNGFDNDINAEDESDKESDTEESAEEIDTDKSDEGSDAVNGSNEESGREDERNHIVESIIAVVDRYGGEIKPQYVQKHLKMHHGVTGAKHWWEQKKNKDGKMVR